MPFAASNAIRDRSIPPPSPHFEMFEHLPAPTLTVEQANKRKPSEMPVLARSIARSGRRARSRRGMFRPSGSSTGTYGSGSE